ncbi:MAG: hypothetical protein ACT4NY_25910 [Pseudonocardiales bacterium]
MLGDVGQLAVPFVVSAPLAPVGEDADVPLPGLRAARRHVTGELLFCGPDDAGVAEILLDLDDGAADLDVDPPAIADLGFELDVEIMVPEPETTAEQQLPHVGLHGGLAAHPLAIGKTTQQLGEVVRRDDQVGGHGAGLSRANDS